MCLTFTAVCDGATKRHGVGFNPHPYDCTQYVQCFYFPRDRAEPVYRQCEYGQFWNHTQLQCLPSHLVNCPHGKCFIYFVRLFCQITLHFALALTYLLDYLHAIT